mgnify:CR=1 FL=1
MEIKFLIVMVISSLMLFSCAEIRTIGDKIKPWIESMLGKEDTQKVVDALDKITTDDEEISWINPDEDKITVKEVTTQEGDEGQHCRQFKVVINEKKQGKGQACRNKETERWKLTDA